MALKIDYNRGVLIRQHGSSGVNVYMYLDDPGVFLSAHGTPVSLEIAEQAGYPVAEMAKKKLLKERLADATKRIQAELEVAQENATVVLERDGFKLNDIGMDRFQVLSPDGDVLNTIPLPRKVAEGLFNQLAPIKS